jgi:DNA-binding beta-propeller fold protein YncE
MMGGSDLGSRVAQGAGLIAIGALVLAGCGGDGPCDRSTVGHICTIAGTGAEGYSGEDGPALSARLSLPTDTLAAPDGSLYIVDWNNHRIRKLTSDGKIHFVAGNGEIGGSLDDPATGDFNHPTGIIFDPTGALIYISAWHNSKIRVLDPATGQVVDSCGDGRRAYFGDEGPALRASLDLPASIAWDPHNNLVVLDQANQVIRSIDPAGQIHRLAGSCVVDEAPPIGPGPCATPMPCPAPSGKTTCATPPMFCTTACAPGYAGDEGPALEMRMAQAFGQAADPGGRIAYDKQGNLYFADTTNDLIRMIDAQGIVHRVAGVAPVNGVPQKGYAGDGGPATSALLNHPVDLALGDDGTLYFSDVYNHCVRAIAPDRTIRTVAGVCGSGSDEVKGYAGDGGPATSALLKLPYGVEWAVPNTLYIADSGNSVIRAVRLP